MTSGNNIETEYLELNSKNEWPALYQVSTLLVRIEFDLSKIPSSNTTNDIGIY